MKRITSIQPLENEIFFIVLTNAIFFIFAFLQNWSSAELLLFFFLQSTIIGIIALSTIILVSMRREKFLKTFFHSLFFILHYFSFSFIIIFITVYESGFLSMNTLVHNLAELFSTPLSKDITSPVPNADIYLLFLPLLIFIFVQIKVFFSKFGKREKNKISLANIHISPYPYHIFVFFFVSLLSTFLVSPLTNTNYANIIDSEKSVNQALLLTFFTTITLIESLVAYLRRKFS